MMPPPSGLKVKGEEFVGYVHRWKGRGHSDTWEREGERERK
jgi:hypothetical protein